MPHLSGMIVECLMSNWALKHLWHLHYSALQYCNKILEEASFTYKKESCSLQFLKVQDQG